jgi:hypothetical protein
MNTGIHENARKKQANLGIYENAHIRYMDIYRYTHNSQSLWLRCPLYHLVKDDQAY